MGRAGHIGFWSFSPWAKLKASYKVVLEREQNNKGFILLELEEMNSYFLHTAPLLYKYYETKNVINKKSIINSTEQKNNVLKYPFVN